MATVSIPIPPSFFRQANQLMADVQRMNQLTAQFIQKAPGLTHVQGMYQAHQATQSQFSRLLHTLRRTSVSLQSGIASVMRAMGTSGQTFVRSLTLASDVLGPIISATVAGISIITKASITAASFGSGLMRWFWDKMVNLGDAMLQDWLMSSGSFSSIGGMQAWRATFGGLLQDDNLIRNATEAHGNLTSRQYMGLRMLGIKAMYDTTDMMVEASIAASHFMKTQRAGMGLIMADAFALTAIFSPEDLIRLQNLSEEELQAYKKMYDDYKPLMQVTHKAASAWMWFSIQVKAAGVQISNIIANKLADSSSPFAQAVRDLSEALLKFFKIVMDSPLTQVLVDTIAHWITKLSKYLSSPEFKAQIEKMMLDMKSIIKDLKETIRLLHDVVDYIKAPVVSGAMPEPRAAVAYSGRRALARRAGIDRGAFSDIKLPGGRREDPRQLEQYIRDRAIAYGVDPNTAVAVARSEGLGSFYGDNRTSFGAFQLHVTRGGGAVGDDFRRDTGLDPSDPRNERATIDYALRYAHDHGWGAWMGARSIGVTGFRGIDRSRALPPREERNYQPGPTPTPQPGTAAPPRYSGDVNQAIRQASRATGISESRLKAVADIESSGNPNAVTGSYKGLFQLSESEFSQYGGNGSIYDPAANAMAAAKKMKAEDSILSQRLGRPITDAEGYLIHQQGYEGAYQHITNPNQPAWQSMYSTAEGQQKGEAWAKRAIWGNVPAYYKRQFGSVDNISSKQFTDMWTQRYNRETALLPTTPGTPVQQGFTPAPGHAGTWQDLPTYSGARDFSPQTVDPRLREILYGAKQRFEAAHPGYTIQGVSGRRPVGAGAGPHWSKTGAIDMIIVGPDGRAIDNSGSDPTGLYHEYARHAYGEMKARYPDLEGSFAWGGAFGTEKGGGGQPDLMHFDLSGDRGHWTQNRMSNMGPMPGVQYGDTASSQAPHIEMLKVHKDSTPRVDIGQIQVGPAVKVDNRSDHDIGQTTNNSGSDHAGMDKPIESKDKDKPISPNVIAWRKRLKLGNDPQPANP